MFSYKTRIRMRDTDAAGVVFFAAQFALAHEAYEELLAAGKVNLGKMIHQNKIHLPIVHAEADYQAPLYLGDALRIEVALSELRKRSFALDYRLVREDDEQAASRVQTVHLGIDSQTRKKTALPEHIQEILKDIRPGVSQE